MASKRKIDETQKLTEVLKKYSVVGLLDLYKLPSRQLQFIRRDLRAQAEIFMRNKCIIERSLEGSTEKKGLKKLLDLDAKEPALMLTNMNPFKLFKILEQNKSPTYAKSGDISTDDIVIPEGPTQLPAGPAIGDFQRVKIPAMIQEGKIHVRKETLLVKKGDEIKPEISDILKKLDIQPMVIGISLLAAWENGIVFGRDILAVDEKEYLNKIQLAYNHAINLSVNTGYPTKQSIKIMIGKAFREVKTLGVECNILDKGVIEDILKKAEIHAQNLKLKTGFND